MSFSQRCKCCGRPQELDFHITDEIWLKIVPKAYQNRVLCLGCFDFFASQKGIGYTNAISELSFIGSKANMIFELKESYEAIVE